MNTRSASLPGALLVAAAVWLVLAGPASAETFRVTGTTDVTGTCELTACASIRQALAAAGASPGPDRIEVPAGDFLLALGRLDVDSEVTLVGAGARSTTVRGDPQNPDRVFFINAVATATISHLTMRDGSVFGGAGGNLLNQAGTVTLDHVRAAGGNATDGGGIANQGGAMTIRQSLIDGNFANVGGGLANVAPTFAAARGLAPGQMTVTDTTIVDNTTEVDGGGVSSVGPGSVTALERVTVARNDSGQSGGLFFDTGGTISVQGSIVTANSGSGPEANCGTSAPSSGGGNVSAGTDCGLTGAGDLQGVDPQLSPTLGGGGETDSLVPAATSPAIDRFACAGADQRDLTRPQGASCDAGAAEVDQAPDTVLSGGAAAGFTFSSTEPGVTFECAVPGVSGFAACASPYVPSGLAPGSYTLLVRAVDAGGRVDADPAAATFVVAAPPAPTPTPTPTPPPAPTPEPTPVTGKSVLAEAVKGTILVKVPGADRFVALDEGVIPNGAEVDARQGTVEITRSDGGAAVFFDGLFKVSQSDGYTTLTLTEKLTGCPKAKRSSASAAAAKPKTRKLWGRGKGRFRTKGQYSAATVRGTKWLVQDTCTTTLTRVSQGVVSVRDSVRKKTIVLRKGKRYTARARR